MSERQVQLGMTFVADMTPARASVEQFIKEISGRAISIPIGGGSSATLGGLGGSGPAPSMAMGSASPNWSVMFSRMTADLTQGITAAINRAVQAASAATSGGSALAPVAGGGGGASGFATFNRVFSRVVGGLAVASAASSLVHYGVNTQLEDVASRSGNRRDLMEAQRNTYKGLVSGLPLVGPLVDYALGGSAGFAQEDQDLRISDAAQESNLRKARIQRGGTRDVFRSLQQQLATTTRGTFARQRLAASQEYDSLGDSLNEQEQELRSRIAFSPDVNERNNLRGELRKLRGANDSRMDAGMRLRNTKIFESNRDQGHMSEIMSGQSDADRLFGRGRARAGELKAFDTETDDLLYQHPDQRADYQNRRTAGRQRIVDENTRGDLMSAIIIGSDIRAVQALLSHDPKSAIRTRANAAIQATYLGDPDDPANILKRSQIAVNRDLELQRFDEAAASVTRGQRTHGRQIEALMRRDPMGAAVAGIVGGAEETAIQLKQHGMMDQAKEAERLGIRQLDLTRQQYSDQFRASTYNLNMRTTENPRDTEDPSKVLKEIRDGQKELTQALKDLASD